MSVLALSTLLLVLIIAVSHTTMLSVRSYRLPVMSWGGGLRVVGAGYRFSSNAVDNVVPRETAPTPITIFVDAEIGSYLRLQASKRKTRLLASRRTQPSLNSIREYVEGKIGALANCQYKLRYRLAKTALANFPPEPLSNDRELHDAMARANADACGIHMFVQSNPGVFPPAELSRLEAETGNDSASAAVRAMKAAGIDPMESENYTMISFYGFRKIDDPAAFAAQLEALWRPFQALGRVYVAKEGVNAQMAVPDTALRFFEAATRSLPVFEAMRLNCDHTVARTDYIASMPFKALHVRVREQILADGLDQRDGELDWKQAGCEMAPLEWHRALTAHKLDQGGGAGAGAGKAVVLDCRNSYESDVGTFEGAVPLNTTFFRETWPALEDLLRDTPKDAPILTYCTGGIRCVKVNAYLQQRMGFTNTHRLAGGIIAYNRELTTQAQRQTTGARATENTSATNIGSREPMDTASRFIGVNYVFDERIGARVTSDVLAVCEQCADTCDSFTNCPNYPCNVRFIQCARCRASYGGCCSKACQAHHVRHASAVAGEVLTGPGSRDRGLLSRRVARHMARKAESAAASATSDDHTEASGREGAGRSAVADAGVEHAYNSDKPSSGGPGLLEALTRYSEEHSTAEPPGLRALREETLQMYAHSPGAARMVCDPLQGAVLRLLVTATGAQSVLELGAFTGYSATALQLGLDGDPLRGSRRVITCEPDATPRAVALKHIQLAGLADHIDVHSVKAAEIMAALRADPAVPVMDLAFVDADKKQYIKYVRTLIGADGGRPLLRDGALIVVDNTLWKGMVLAEPAKERGLASSSTQETSPDRMQALAAAMHAFNIFAATEPRLQPVVLPLRDGLTVMCYRSQGSTAQDTQRLL